MAELVILCKIHEWLAGVLWTVVQYHLWDVVSCEDAFHPPDNLCRRTVQFGDLYVARVVVCEQEVGLVLSL